MQSISRWLLAATAVLSLAFAANTGAQSIFRGDFELPYGIPADDAEAARFLNQATFGATPSSIAQARSQGLVVWLSSQQRLPATLARPFLEGVTPTENAAGTSLSQTHRVHRWVDTAVTAPDQLRQKAAWALGQMIVVSDEDAGLSGETIMMAEWTDLIVRNALGNFRTLLGEVLRSPMMGRYLTHLRNRKFEIEPRCWDQRPNGQGQFDNRLTSNPPYHSCTSSDATNNNSMAPRIAAYVLPNSGLVAPDENFAREVMQLFTIGLIERNANFTPFPDAMNPQPTYDQNTITTLSRVMTGLNYNCTGDRVVAGRVIPRNCNCTGTDCSFQTGNFFSTPGSLQINDESGLVHPDRYERMICYPRYHDTGRDRAGFQLPGSGGQNPVGATVDLDTANGQSIPGGTPGRDKVLELGGQPMLTFNEVGPGQPRSDINCDGLNTNSIPSQKNACLSYCNNSLEAAIDLLFLEPNTATMVARHMIQRLVSSNPSPAYIARVAGVFAANRQGVRGDLAAVVNAVLLDPEAREPVSNAGQLVNRGKPREPLLKLIQIWRSIGATSGDTRADGFRRWARFANGCGSGSWPECAYQQRPFGAPTVFNFYEPDYQAPGGIADQNLFSPEFQIINEATAVLTANDLYTQICAGWGNNCHSRLTTVPTSNAYFPPAVLDALPGANCGTTCTPAQDAQLIEALNLRLFGGTMSGALGNSANPANAANTGMKGTLLRFLQLGITGSMGESDPQNARRREILYLLHLVSVSPDYATQR
jgi:uncharacterized protein (DUF1800 family)